MLTGHRGHEQDEPLIEGRGPTVVVEYEVEFDGTLHVWTESELDIFLQVDDATEARPLVADDNSGGGTTPYLKLDVEKGDWLMVLAAGGPGDTGALTLRETLDHATQIASEIGRASCRERV
jgi:hypothetical protein